jgi:hypothetical protein
MVIYWQIEIMDIVIPSDNNDYVSEDWESVRYNWWTWWIKLRGVHLYERW